MPRLVSFLINAPRSGLQAELDAFFDHALDGHASRPLTKSALCQARRELRTEALRTLLGYSAALLADHAPAPRWQGRRVLALDGTTLRVPDVPDCAEYFGGMQTSCGKFRPLARASAVFDVARGCFVDAVLGSYDDDERSLALSHLDELGTDDLLVMDRGYPSRGWFMQLQARGIGFCARISGDHRWTTVRQFTRAGVDDAVVDLGTVADPLPLRLIRCPLPNGTLLVLATNVLDKTLTPVDFAELYRRRWRIEEAFKLVKARLQIENWSGVLPHTVEQDFFAGLLRINCAAALSAEVAAPDEHARIDARGYRRRLNFTQVLKSLRHLLPKLLLGLQRTTILARLIERLSSPGAFERSKPDRSLQRKKGVRIAGFHPAYKAA